MTKSLLNRLETALDKLYDGNISAHQVYDDYVERTSHQDQYKCDCGATVPEEEWSEEYKICRDCYMEMMEDHGHKWGAR